MGALAVMTYHTPLWGLTTALISLCEWLVWALNGLAYSFAHWPGAVLTLPAPPWMWVLLSYAVLGWLTLMLRHTFAKDVLKADLLPQHWSKLPVMVGFDLSEWPQHWSRRVKQALILLTILVLPLAMTTWVQTHRTWVAWLPLDSSYEWFHRGALAQWVHNPESGDTLSVTLPSGQLKPYQVNLIQQWLGHNGQSHVARLVIDMTASSLNNGPPSALGSLIQRLKPSSVAMNRTQWDALSAADQQSWLKASEDNHYRLIWIEGAWQLSPASNSGLRVLAYGRPGWTSAQGSLLYRIDSPHKGGCVLVGGWSSSLIAAQSRHCQLRVTRPRSSSWLLESNNVTPAVSHLLQNATALMPTRQGQWRLKTR